MGPAACLFDLDGLLLDTEPLQAKAWHNAASHFGCELGSEQLLSLQGQRRLDCAALVCRWIAASGKNPPSCEALLAVRQPLADALLANAAAMEGAAELVQMCRGYQIPMALVTSSSQNAVRRKAAPHKWLELIQVRIYGDDPALEAGKPSPDPFLLAAKRLGLNPNECWAFEDSAAGIEAAVAAGCQVFALIPSEAGVQTTPAGVTRLKTLKDVCW
ncbi:MAG: HAD family phosphatase [Cyanobacteria bacterium]|nr:HAD family phosphatase [Cyanobacteriota bacterium]MDA1246182.1 HAD family phosphatase [Cyanobacteriota bacterium]